MLMVMVVDFDISVVLWRLRVSSISAGNSHLSSGLVIELFRTLGIVGLLPEEIVLLGSSTIATVPVSEPVVLMLGLGEAK